MTVFEEVFAAAKTEGVKEQAPGQPDAEYIFSIALGVGKCNIDLWNALSVEAQQWYDAVVKAQAAYKEIVPPTGFVSKNKVKPVVKPEPVKKVQAPVVISKPEPVVAKTKPEGVVSAIRRTIILNHDWTSRKVHEYLVQNGWPNLKLDVVNVNAGDIRKTVEMVKALNKWKD